MAQALFSKRREDDWIGKVHGVDETGGDKETALRGAGQLHQAGKQPGNEEQRESNEACCHGKFPQSGVERDLIEGDENRGW